MKTRVLRLSVAAIVVLTAGAALVPAQVRQQATAIEGPFVANVTQHSVVIWWRSDSKAPGTVVVSGERRLTDSDPPYEVTVEGLSPATTYTYYLELADGRRIPAQGRFRFRTAPRPGAEVEFKFAVMCDSRGSKPSEPVNAAVLRYLLDDARRRGARFVVFPGDLIFGYCHKPTEYRAMLRTWKAAAATAMHEMPVYTTMGNHDVVIHRTKDSRGPYDLDGVVVDGRVVFGEQLFAEEFVNPTNGPPPERDGAPPYTETAYSFDYGPCHFVVLNTNYWMATRTWPHEPGDPCRLYERGNPEGRLMDRQLRWLERDLRQARRRGAKHIFVFGHEPAFPMGKHVDDAMYYDGPATLSLKRDVRQRRHRFWSILSRYKVLAAFFGDEHNYSRAIIGPAGERFYDPPVWHIITGGAGAPLTLAKPAPDRPYVPPSVPHEYRRLDMPWNDAVRTFEIANHYCLVTVSGDRVSLEVWALPEGWQPGQPAQMRLIDRDPNLCWRD